MTFSLDGVALLQVAVGTVLPLLVGLVTTRVTAPGVKALLLAVLSLVSSVASEAVAAATTGRVFDLGVSLTLALPTFLVAVGMHYGLWKPVGASEALQDVAVASGKGVAVDGSEGRHVKP